MIFSIFSGLCGSFGSLMGKLAFHANLPFHDVIRSYCCKLLAGSCVHWATYIIFAARIFLFGLMMVFNTFMISTFLKALERNVNLTSSTNVFSPCSCISNIFRLLYLLQWLAHRSIFFYRD